MTWRAFILGLLAVVAVALVDPYTSFNKNWGWNTQGHFPVAAVFILVLFTVGLNALLKLVRRRLALRQAELMLIWCMLIVGFSLPSNPMRLHFPMLAAPAYLARRPDIPWKDTALEAAPGALLLTKDPRSLAAEQFFEGQHGEGRVPWELWLKPLSRWAVFMLFYYLAVLFLCALLRRQWVDRERLQFPLARVPLEFTEGSDGAGLFSSIFSQKAFVAGVVGSVALRLCHSLPVFFGGAAWGLVVPFQDALQETPLQYTYLLNVGIGWTTVGLAYLVPADVSLSMWFFYLFGRFELQTAAWLGSSLHYGGTYGSLCRWQRPGAYLAFTVGALFLARRHLADVVRKALRSGSGAEDVAEPVGFRFGFWGLMLCSAGAVAWFAFYGMKVWVAAVFFALLMVVEFVIARIVAQSGLFITVPISSGPQLLQAFGFGRVFGPTGAAIANMQYQVMTGPNNSLLGPVAAHAFRIAEVFRRGRRLLLPALVAALLVSMAASTWTCVHQAYRGGALNWFNVWSATGNPKNAFDMTHRMMTQPEQVAAVRWVPFLLGVSLTGFVMFMRARFYWWPVHSVGLLAFAGYNLDRMWLSFFVGWLIKVTFAKFGSGQLLRRGRLFFIGLIVTDFFFDGLSTLLRTLTAGVFPGF